MTEEPYDLAKQARSEVQEMLDEHVSPGAGPFPYNETIASIERALAGGDMGNWDPDDPAYWTAVVAELRRRRDGLAG